MGVVPDAYYEFVMHYAPWFYVITTAMVSDPPEGQKNVAVTDGSQFSVGMEVEIKDSAHSEWNEVDSINGNTVSSHVKAVKALFRVNGLKLELPYNLSNRTIYNDRAPTPEELQHILDIADLRLKVIVSTLALGGFRIGTLAKLQYRHVKRDLEKMTVPIHVHVEAEITKGKYHDYDTFLGQEAADYLRTYLEVRRQGTHKIPPESIHDQSPLIRNQKAKHPVPIDPSALHTLIHDLYLKGGLIQNKPLGRLYELRAHSIRKFFRTQLASLNVQTDYIEYMMGHTISTYHDIQMKGIEFLRGIYMTSALSIKPKTKVSKIDALKEIIRAWGLNPEQILTKDVLMNPHRTVVDHEQAEESQVNQLTIALKQQMIKELREKPNEK